MHLMNNVLWEHRSGVVIREGFLEKVGFSDVLFV